MYTCAPMPSFSLTPDQICNATTRTGVPCHAPHLTGKPYCLFHSPEHHSPGRQRIYVDPSIPLHELSRIAFDVPAELQRFRRAVLEHVLSGSLDHQTGSAAIRIAQVIADAAPSSRDRTGTTAAVARLLAAPPPVDEG